MPGIWVSIFNENIKNTLIIISVIVTAEELEIDIAACLPTPKNPSFIGLKNRIESDWQSKSLSR